MRRRAVALVIVVGLVACACGGTSLIGSENDLAGDVDGPAVGSGQALYEANCTACHAEGGVGIEGVGKPLVGSEFVAGLSDTELVEFLVVGRDTADPLNTTGILKPPRGGNPSLTEEDLALIVEYLRSLAR
jgi:mono/diheme cytochrome c family protein